MAQLSAIKACLLAQGFSQQYGVDYDDKHFFHFKSLRTVIAIPVQNNLHLHQMDFMSEW